AAGGISRCADGGWKGVWPGVPRGGGAGAGGGGGGGGVVGGAGGRLSPSSHGGIWVESCGAHIHGWAKPAGGVSFSTGVSRKDAKTQNENYLRIALSGHAL